MATDDTNRRKGASRRRVLRTVGGVAGLSLVPIGSVTANSQEDQPSSRHVNLDVSGIDGVSKAEVMFFEDEHHVTRVTGELNITEKETDPVRHSVEVEKPTDLADATASISSVTQDSDRESGNLEGGEDSATENELATISTMDAGGTDNTKDFEGGAVASSDPEWVPTTSCESKQYATWTSTDGNVGWIDRAWRAWSDIDYDTNAAGFADIDWDGDDCYTKSFADYQGAFTNDSWYMDHRIELWCLPNGQMEYSITFDGRGGKWDNSWELHHTDRR